MKILSYNEAFRMISLLKGEFRTVRFDTNELESANTLTHEEKYEKLKEIEKRCVQNTMKYTDVDEDFISELHNLLIDNTNNLTDREVDIKNLLYKYVDGNIDRLFHFMNRELFGEYERAINHPKFIINLQMNKSEEWI